MSYNFESEIILSKSVSTTLASINAGILRLNAIFIYMYISLSHSGPQNIGNKQNDHLLSSLRIYLLVLRIAYSNYLDDFFNLALSISKGISCLETLFDLERRFELLRETLSEFFTCLLSGLSSSWMEFMWL